MKLRRAVIDIGTNSVKLLVAEIEGHSVVPLWEGSEQTRLGQGFYPDHRLSAGAISRTAESVARFVARAKTWEPESIRVVATSAARDAVNQSELLQAISSVAQLQVEVISGHDEADLVFAGVCTDPQFADKEVLIVDVGGGSTEFIVGSRSHQEFRQSFSLGTVRLLERFLTSDPPTPAESATCDSWLLSFLELEVKPLLAPHLSTPTAPRLLIGTGGTPALLAAMDLAAATFDRNEFERLRLPLAGLLERQRQLWSLPLSGREKIPGLPANRADVILFGVAAFTGLMRVLGFEELRVSTRGLRFGALER